MSNQLFLSTASVSFKTPGAMSGALINNRPGRHCLNECIPGLVVVDAYDFHRYGCNYRVSIMEGNGEYQRSSMNNEKPTVYEWLIT